MPLVINSLGGGPTHKHTHTHTDVRTGSMLGNQARAGLRPACASFNDENTPPQHLASSKDALEGLDICMRRMEQQEETTPQQAMLFQKLKNDAAKKRSASLKWLSMNDFVL